MIPGLKRIYKTRYYFHRHLQSVFCCCYESMYCFNYLNSDIKFMIRTTI